VSETNEADLISRARAGEAAAWEALVHNHEQRVYRLAYLMLADPDEAQDVVQNTFIRAYQHLNNFDDQRPLQPWLLRIASNLALNRRRSIGRYWFALQRLARPDLDVRRTTEGAAVNREGFEALWQAVRRLSELDQRVIYLRYFLELSEAETASALEVPAGTVKSRLHRALIRLRTIIERDFPELREGLYP
jgi:RNA polymerase sigma-70 factor (ECF subfamily)